MVATGEEVRQVEELANAFFPDFLPRLCQAGAGLRSRQRTLCLLTKLNFMPSEIAVLTGRSLQAVSNMRSRTCAALFGADRMTSEFDSLIGKL